MQIITNAKESVLTILKRFRKAGASYRLMKYCMEEEVEDGVLLFNLLTREMVLLNREEREGILEDRSMRERWFVVPEDTNEKELVDLVRWMSNARKKPLETITRFSIFPTTDCNARCFYCFEKGCSRIHMSQETAQKVVGFVKTRSGGQKAHLAWFGGEPLFNQSAIDTICQGLAQEGVEYYSTMVSNGYLFDEETVRKAVGSWDLKNVQITLDGTEKVYNRSKAYIYQEGSPYQVVMGNIQRLLDAEYKDNLQAMLHEPTFRFAVDRNTWGKLPFIVKLGNLAVHTERSVQSSDALESLKGLFEFVQWIDYCYGSDYEERQFDEAIIPVEKVIVDSDSLHL